MKPFHTLHSNAHLHRCILATHVVGHERNRTNGSKLRHTLPISENSLKMLAFVSTEKYRREQIVMIETERLWLRGWQNSDKPRFIQIINTARMMEHMGGVKNPAEIEELIDKQIAMQAAHGLSMWAMEDKASGLIIGICGLRYGGHPNTPVSDELEIGWRVAESAWGMGYAREAAEACLTWGWQHTTRTRIAAWTVQSNHASWGLMMRLGMTRRPDLDFDHPRFESGHPLQRHITYVIDRAAGEPRSF